jgi:hypothetical protein
VGHDFRYKAGQNSEFTELEDGRLKYVVPNKFVPFEYDYEVVIAPGQEKVTFTPVAMSNRYRSLTVNGKPVSSRCPVTVPTDEPVKIVCVGPDGTEPEQPYVFTFVTEE